MRSGRHHGLYVVRMTPLCIFATLVLMVAGASATHAQTAAVREGFLSVPGARLFYTDAGGTGTPVVMLHAATGNTNAGLDRVHLVSTAGGGFVAFDFAIAFPTRLRSLVVADSIGGVQDREILDLETRIRPPQFDDLPPEVRELGPSYRSANPDGTRRWLEIEKQSRTSRPTASTLQLAYATPMRNQLALALYEQIRTPALLLTGGADMTAPPTLMKILASHISNAEFVVVPNAGHSVYWEEPETFNRTVLDFMRKH